MPTKMVIEITLTRKHLTAIADAGSTIAEVTKDMKQAVRDLLQEMVDEPRWPED